MGSSSLVITPVLGSFLRGSFEKLPLADMPSLGGHTISKTTFCCPKVFRVKRNTGIVHIANIVIFI